MEKLLYIFYSHDKLDEEVLETLQDYVEESFHLFFMEKPSSATPT